MSGGAPSPAAAPSPPRLVYLDGLRGLAALMVVVFHLWGAAGTPRWLVHLPQTAAPSLGVTLDLLSPLGALGGSRVSLFFVLSGFLLYLPFARGGAAAEASLWGWLRRRFRRLVPPYYAALGLSIVPLVASFYLKEAWRCWVLHLAPRAPDFGNLSVSLPASLLFLHGMVPGAEMPAFNSPLWTITPEVQLYLTFPLLVWLATRRRLGGLKAAVGLAVVASVLYRVWLFHHFSPPARAAMAEVGTVAEAAWFSSAYHCLCNTFLGRWAEFAVGMGAAGLVARGRVPHVLFTAPACAACLAWFLVLRSDIAVGGWIGRLFLAMEPAPSPLADAVGGAAFALLLLWCAATPRLARALSWRPLTAVGTISFSLYLVHTPVVAVFDRALDAAGAASPWLTSLTTPGDGQGSLGRLLLYLLLLLPLALGAARLFWRAFERPFLSAERYAGLSVAAPPPAAPAAPAAPAGASVGAASPAHTAMP